MMTEVGRGHSSSWHESELKKVLLQDQALFGSLLTPVIFGTLMSKEFAIYYLFLKDSGDSETKGSALGHSS